MSDAVSVMSLDQAVSFQCVGVEDPGEAATFGNAPLVVSDQSRRAMTKTARVYKIEMLIRNRGRVSSQALLDDLEVSPATLKRDLEHLKDRLGAPIVYDRFLNGYKFGEDFRGQAKHELPGLWFNERELYSLLMAHPTPKNSLPKRYYGTVRLDSERAGRDAGQIAAEVNAYLTGFVGANVEVTLEITAEIPDGVPEQVLHTVTENGRTLKLDPQGFEAE